MQLSSFILCLLYVSLHYILLDSRIYLLMQVTYDRLCVLVPPRSMCSTYPRHLPAMGNLHAVYCMGTHLRPHHRIHQLALSSYWPCKTS
jgi:hypothetical protein